MATASDRFKKQLGYDGEELQKFVKMRCKLLRMLQNENGELLRKLQNKYGKLELPRRLQNGKQLRES